MLFAEYGGSGIFLSVNYESVKRVNDVASVGLGWGFSPLQPSGRKLDLRFVPKLPFNISILLGKKNSKFEAGFSTVPYLILNHNRQFGLYFQPRIGYRYQKMNGLFFRVQLAPIIYDSGMLNRPMLLGGVAIGGCFE